MKCSENNESLFFFSIIFMSVGSKNRLVQVAGTEVAAQSRQ